MTQALQQFEINLISIRGFTKLYGVAPTHLVGVDREDLSRSQVVMLVSALDQYVHEAVRLGMLQTFAGIRPETNAFQNFTLKTYVLRQALASPGSDAWLDSHIRSVHRLKSFQMPNKIAEAISLVTAISIWDHVAAKMQAPRVDITRELELIVTRRNQIVHEADLNPAFPGQRYPMSRSDVQRAIRHVTRIARAVDTAF